VQPFILINQIAAIFILSQVRPIEAGGFAALQFAAPAVLGAYFGFRIFEMLSTKGFNRIVGVALALAGTLLALKGY
jgi:hypothetical protein